MRTALGIDALTNLKRFQKHCTNEEFLHLEKGVKEFDTLLTGSGFYAIQSKQKLTAIKIMSFETFLTVMFAYFGKTVKDLKNI